MKYVFVCSCGHEITTEAESRDEAVDKLKAMMSEEEIEKHMRKMHAGEPVMTKEEVDMGIEEGTVEAETTDEFRHAGM